MESKHGAFAISAIFLGFYNLNTVWPSYLYQLTVNRENNQFIFHQTYCISNKTGCFDKVTLMRHSKLTYFTECSHECDAMVALLVVCRRSHFFFPFLFCMFFPFIFKSLLLQSRSLAE